VAGDIPAERVLESDRTLAFRDIRPQAPTHVLVIPKGHYRDFGELVDAGDGLVAEVAATAREIATSEGLAGGYRVVFNTGPDTGQTVFHVHAHVLGGRQMGWPPG
jgi:histidine triad (HIT) family protein